MPRPTCVIATAVWGPWHTEVFLSLNIPTLLAEGNLPRFVGEIDAVYTIHTTQRDWDRLNQDERFRRLARLLEVRFALLEASDIGNPIETHHKVWRRAIDEAAGNGSYVILMPPDVAWADGSISHLGRLMTQGKKAVFLNWHVRSVQDTFVADFRDRYRPTADDGIAIPARDLVRLSLQHAHPITGASLRDSPYFPHHPEMIFWPVKGQGLLMRVLALVPFVFRPDQVALTPQRTVALPLAPSDMEFVTDSDDLYMVSLAEIGKDSDWYKANIPLDALEVARWWLYFDSPTNDELVTHSYRLHFSADCTSAAWRDADAQARSCVHRLMATREVLRIRHAAWRMDCKTAAHILDHVLMEGLAPALVGHRRPLAIFIPTDDALASHAADLARLCEPDRRADLIRAIRAHLVPADLLPRHATEPLRNEFFLNESDEWIQLGISGVVSPDPTHFAPAAPESVGRHLLFRTPRVLADLGRHRWQGNRTDPERTAKRLVEAAAEGADPTSLDRLVDTLRGPGVDAALMRRVLDAIGMKPAEYRGFDCLPGGVRETALSGDPWSWHRKWVDSDLPLHCRRKLAADLAFLAGDPVEIRQLESSSSLPRHIAQVALGRAFERADRRLDAAGHYRAAIEDNAASGPVLRHAAALAYQDGDGRLANELYNMSLHTEDWDAFKLAITDARHQAPIRDYYGLDYWRRGSVYISELASAAPVVQTQIQAIKARLARIIPFALRAWMADNLPRPWVVALRDAIYASADLASRARRRIRRLRELRKQPHGKSRDLVDLAHRMKAAAKTV